MGGIGLLIGLVLAGAIEGGRYAYKYFWSGDPGVALKSGQDAYARGATALAAGDGVTAAVRFDEARLEAQMALDNVAQQLQRPNLTKEVQGGMQQQEGEAFWLKARALRDLAYAKAIQERKPITELTDTATGEKYRSLIQIPDADIRGEALTCLRQAAVRLTQSLDVQKELLRTEMSLQPLIWGNAERAARNVFQLNARDPWALYVLARYDYEQPPTDAKETGPGQLPLEKRSRERMLKSRDYLIQLKSTGNYALWRTLYLEAELDQWFAQDAAAQKKPKEQQAEESALRALLLDEQNGALQRAQQGERLPVTSLWDVDGVFGVHSIALDLTIADQRQGATTTERVLAVLDKTLAFCDKLTGEDASNPAVAEAAMTAVQSVAKVQPLVALAPPPKWRASIQTAQLVARKALDKNLPKPAIYAEFAQFLEREAELQGNRSNKTRQAELRKQALQWAEDGLKAGHEGKLASAPVAELNALAAELKTVMGAKREDITPNLDALRQASLPGAPALADLLDGAIAEREGRLEKARQSLEKVLSSPNPDLTLRAHLVLANVYMGLGEPDRAVVSLRELEKGYGRFEQMSPQDKAWALEFMRGPQELGMLLAMADLDTARIKVSKFIQQNPDKPVPADLYQGNEAEVARVLKTLPPQSSQERTVRLALVAYLATSGRRAQAQEGLAQLKKDYPSNVEVLQLEVGMLMQPDPKAPAPKPGEKPTPDPKAVETADARIQQFISDNPGNLSARLLWADWLLQTRRADKALAYLQDPANFPGGKDDVYYRVLARAMAGTGEREAGMKVLQHLQHDPAVDAALIEVAATRAEQQKEVGDALARYENNGLFRYWNAALDFNAGKYAEAADGFASTVEFTRVKPLAQEGLRRALIALANQDPSWAKGIAAQKLKESGDDPNLFLAEAYACLKLDEVGSPTDTRERVVNMASLLNAWEQAFLKTQSDRVPAPLTKAEFWALANLPEIALTEVNRALKQDPQNQDALKLAVALALEIYEPARAAEYVATLEKALPDDPQTHWLRGQVQEADGRDADAVKSYEELVKKPSAYQGPAYARLVALLGKLGEKQKAHDALQEWRKVIPDDLAAAQAEVGELVADGQNDAARKVADQFLEDRLKEGRKQIAALKPLAGADPGTVEKQREAMVGGMTLLMQYEMARAFFQARAWDEAEARARRVLDKQPNEAGTTLLLGDIAMGRQAWDKARDEYAKVFDKDKANFVAGNNLAWLLAVRLNDVDAAYKIVQQLRKGRFSSTPVSGDRMNAEFLDTLGAVLRKVGTPEALVDMREVFEAARRRYPTDPRVCLYLGCAYAGVQQTNKAQDMFSAALALAGPNAKNGLSAEQRQTLIQEVEQAQKKLKGA
jgi:predicted Zn-dependent protease